VERLFWTRGLADALEVDGAYVATTDKRKSLRSVATKLNLHLIDGGDIQRIQSYQTSSRGDRITDEQLIQELQQVDRDFRNRNLQESRQDILSSLADGFGAPSTVRGLGGFARLAAAAVSYHPNSSAARAAGRLAYLAAAIACESLDYVSVGTPCSSHDERRELILTAVRYGGLDKKTLRLALGLIEKYAPSGRSTATTVENNLKMDLKKIPAEIVAEQAVKLLKDDQLFAVGRELEMACYQSRLPTFDKLSVPVRSILGAFLDYSGVDRERFAEAWGHSERLPRADVSDTSNKDTEPQSNLFSEDK
jgi:hypothetical protein